MLVITNGPDGEIVWQGKFFEIDAEFVMPVQASSDCLVLLNGKQAVSKGLRNLIRCTPTGEIKWQAGIPTKTMKDLDRSRDFYRTIQLKDKTIEAYSFLSFLDYIDINTGKVVDTEFLK